MKGMASKLTQAPPAQTLPAVPAGPESIAPAASPLTAPMPGRVKPSFFGQGGMGQYMLGFLGDALTGRPMFGSMIQQQQRDQFQDKLWDRRFQQQEQVLAAREAAAARRPTNLQLEYEWLQSKDPAAAQAYLKRQTQERPIPVQGFDANGNQTLTFVYPSQMSGGQPAQPPARLDRLPPNAKPLGGPTQPASGGFR